MRGDLCIDGSCGWPTNVEAARTGWAAVQVDAAGAVIVADQGFAEFGKAQTAVTGEQEGLLQGTMQAEPGLTVHVDCATLLAQDNKP